MGSNPTRDASSGVIRIIIGNLSSPISPIKPLGGYEILANIADEIMTWSIATTNGPLLLKGQGELVSNADSKVVHFSGEASASPEAQESLAGLLSVLGKKEGDTYRLRF
jgi:general secretion pathway protein N